VLARASSSLPDIRVPVIRTRSLQFQVVVSPHHRIRRPTQATKMLEREFEKLIHVNWFEVKDVLGEVCIYQQNGTGLHVWLCLGNLMSSR
jgi:hypothetical protein